VCRLCESLNRHNCGFSVYLAWVGVRGISQFAEDPVGKSRARVEDLTCQGLDHRDTRSVAGGDEGVGDLGGGFAVDEEDRAATSLDARDGHLVPAGTGQGEPEG